MRVLGLAREVRVGVLLEGEAAAIGVEALDEVAVGVGQPAVASRGPEMQAINAAEICIERYYVDQPR